MCAAHLLVELRASGLNFPKKTQLRFCALVFKMYGATLAP